MRDADQLDFVQLRGSAASPSGIPAASVAVPSVSLDDPRFRYVPACKTDLAETFRRARERQA